MLSEKRTFGNLWGYDIGKGGTIVILFIITILPLWLLSFYSQPTADDFLFTNEMHSKGFWGNLKFQYFCWSGRYFAHALYSLNPLSFNSGWAYKLNFSIWMSLLMISSIWLSKKMFAGMENRGIIGVALLFLLSYILLIPDVSAFFWQTSLYTLVTPDFLTFFLLGCIIQYYNGSNKTGYLILSCLLCIAIIGSYEPNMVYLDMIIFVFTVFRLITTKNNSFPLVLLGVCILFSIISIAAPGNHVRGNLFPKAHQFMYSLKQSYIFGREILVHSWMPFMLFIGLLSGDFLLKALPVNKQTETIFSMPIILTLAGCISIPFIGFFIGFYAEGAYPLPRTLNQVYFYFDAAIIYFTLCCIVKIKNHYPDFYLHAYIKLPLYAFLLYALFIKPNPIITAYKDLFSGTAQAYNKQLEQRNEYLLNFKGDSCKVDSLKYRPASFYFLDVQRDPHHWYDTNLCRYYNKRYIGVK